MYEMDKWAVQQLQKLISGVREAYDNFLFHRVFSLLYNFCTVEMSSIYMDVLKDRMYCDWADSLSRRSGQTAMHRILDALVRLLAPILVHTAEEAWSVMKSSLVALGSSLAESAKVGEIDSVHLAEMPEVDETIDWRAEEARWEKLMGLRDEVLRVLEGLRREQKIGSNQEASVTVYSDDEELMRLLNEFGLEQFAALCIVSEVKLLKASGETSVAAEKSSHAKCQRCWNYWPSVGKDGDHPDLCERCLSVVTRGSRQKDGGQA
jgi:isoleucyl-tRNA synthetase